MSTNLGIIRVANVDFKWQHVEGVNKIIEN